MAVSVIRVFNNKIKNWESDVKVCIEFKRDWGQEFLKEVQTDENGWALVEHKYTGDANIYVNGNFIGSFYAPGNVTIQI